MAGSLGGIHASRSGLVWEWLRVLDEMEEKPRILTLENVTGLLSTNGGDNYRVLHMALVERLPLSERPGKPDLSKPDSSGIRHEGSNGALEKKPRQMYGKYLLAVQ